MLDYRKLTAEAVGTFALVFMGAGSIIASQGTNLVAIALAHGLAIAVLVSTLGHVSGGVFNPALTIGLWATRRLSAVDAAGYIAAQLAGAVLGAVFLVATFPATARELVNLGTPVLASGVGFAEGALVEVVLTFFLMLAVFGTAIDPRGPRVGGLFVGLVFTMDIATGFGLTGAAMNPARTFGPALLSGTWDDHLVYWVGPILGAVSAAMLYHYVFEDEEDTTA